MELLAIARNSKCILRLNEVRLGTNLLNPNPVRNFISLQFYFVIKICGQFLTKYTDLQDSQ